MEEFLLPPPGMPWGDFILVVVFLLVMVIFVLCTEFRL